jgi:hypothetical protein
MWLESRDIHVFWPVSFESFPILGTKVLTCDLNVGGVRSFKYDSNGFQFRVDLKIRDIARFLISFNPNYKDVEMKVTSFFDILKFYKCFCIIQTNSVNYIFSTFS